MDPFILIMNLFLHILIMILSIWCTVQINLKPSFKIYKCWTGARGHEKRTNCPWEIYHHKDINQTTWSLPRWQKPAACSSEFKKNMSSSHWYGYIWLTSVFNYLIFFILLETCRLRKDWGKVVTLLVALLVIQSLILFAVSRFVMQYYAFVEWEFTKPHFLRFDWWYSSCIASLSSFCGQGVNSDNSTGIAQRARHPDELKQDGKWMIDIDYYLSQQVFLIHWPCSKCHEPWSFV